MHSSQMTISQAAAAYLDAVHLSRSHNTARTYRNGISIFLDVLNENRQDPDLVPAVDLKEEAVLWLAAALKNHAPSAKELYLTAVTGFTSTSAPEK